ncbi:MAG: PAS domain S-box protein, partial [Candidatus Caldatribacteriota bacterium]|nr:PAS domain S-box protein [Candidatus Caldatribacteriota bacterium]
NESIISVDFQGNLLTLNNRAVSYLGGAAKNYAGKTLWDIFPKKVADERFKDNQKVIRSGKTVIKENYVPFKGRTLCFLTSIQPIKNRSGDIYAVLILASDITDRKKIENALAESEERYHTVFKNTGTATVIIEEDKIISMANTQFEKLSGYSKAEIENKMKWTDFIFPEDLKMMEKYHSERRKAGSKAPTEYEFRLMDKKGNIKNIFLKIGIIPGSKKSVASLIDITEQKQAEEELRDSEERLKILFDYAPDAYYINDLKGNIIDGNIAAERIIGYKREELIGKNFLKLKLVSFTDIPKAAKLLAKNVMGLPTGPDELALNRKDNSKVIVEIFTYPVKIKGRTLVLGIARDVTEQKQAEKALRESEQKFRDIANLLPQIVYEIDIYGNLTFVNKQSFNSFGYSQEEYEKGFNVLQALIPEDRDRAKENMQNILYGKSIGSSEYTALRKDGSTFPTLIYSSAILKDNKPVGLRGIVVDITERKQAEERLKKTLDAAIDTMSKIVEVKDPYTAGHQKRVSQLATAIAKELNLSQDKIEGVRIASLIHDIGKISVPTEILTKSTTLTDIEFSLIKTHSQTGYDILKSIDFSYPIAQIVLQHHERLNGSGYPQGLKDEDILLDAKIIGVADVVEAMSSHRPYRPALGLDKALEEISKNRGILYDPEVADVCLKLFKEKGFKFE